MDEPVSVTLYGGTAAVHHEQGQGQIAFTVTATRDQIAAGSEWAVIVTGNRRGTVGQGTITVDAPEPPAPEAGALDTWLRAHPAVAFHLTWNDGERSRSYSAWPAEMREALGSAVEAARAGRFSLADDPPANAWKRASDDPDAVHTAFAPEVARALYIATVAHSLAVEIDRRVPWSLDDLNGDELETLLASSSLFGWNPEQRGYEISEFDHGWATPAQPATSWAFLQQQRLLASSRLDTIVALVGWRRNLTHFAGPVSRQNFREHWGYDGDMPVARALSGTRYTGTVFASIPGYDAVRHYTAGCQGTAGLFASVLRAANIPVRLRSVSNDSTPHATILFLSEDRGLSHGDDPYSLLSEGAPPADLLIDLSTYEKWLGSTSKDAGRYIGRQSQALALQRLPPIVRHARARSAIGARAGTKRRLCAVQGQLFHGGVAGSAIVGAPGASANGRDRSPRCGALCRSVVRGRIGKCDGDGRNGRAPAAGPGAARPVAQSAAAALERCAAWRRALTPVRSR